MLYLYNRVDAGSIYAEGAKGKKPIWIKPGKVYPAEKFDPDFLKRLVEDGILVPIEE